MKAVKTGGTAKSVRLNLTRKAVNSKIRGVDVDTTRFRYNKSPVESTNGTLKVFTLPDSEAYVSGLVEVFLDGIKQTLTTDYTESSSTTVTFVTAPDSDETIILNYIKA